LAGQVNLTAKTVSNSITASSADAQAATTSASSAASLNAGSITTTIGETALNQESLQGPLFTIARTLDSTTSFVETVPGTIIRTSAGASGATIVQSSASARTASIQETLTFDSQPADVSIEISQDGLNLSSPFSNVLTAGALNNAVDLTGTSGINQVQANAGNANVTVATNSIINATVFSDLTFSAGQVVLKNLSAITLVPGFAVQNSSSVSVAEIAGMALAAAEGSSDTLNEDILLDTDGTTIRDRVIAANIVTAVDISQVDIAEYSPHHNTANFGDINNRVAVLGTAGVTQIQANAGNANSGGVHNLIVYDAELAGDAFRFEP
jgi:hypothetical protein